MNWPSEVEKGALGTPPSFETLLDPSSPDFDIVAWFDRSVPPEVEDQRRFKLGVLRSIDTGERPAEWPANQNVVPNSTESSGERDARLSSSESRLQPFIRSATDELGRTCTSGLVSRGSTDEPLE